jgi:hypothetical protein
MTFRDDECRIRTQNAPANFTPLRHEAHNLVRKAPEKDSLRLRRHTVKPLPGTMNFSSAPSRLKGVHPIPPGFYTLDDFSFAPSRGTPDHAAEPGYAINSGVWEGTLA